MKDIKQFVITLHTLVHLQLRCLHVNITECFMAR